MSISPSPMLIWVSQWSQCFKIRVAQHWGGRRHISGGKTVWSTTCRIFPENLREKVSVSTICDEYCSFSAHWTPVVQRATFWCSKQSIDLISHSLKILIYPTLNYIDISFYFPIKRYESHLMEPPFFFFSCVYEGFDATTNSVGFDFKVKHSSPPSLWNLANRFLSTFTFIWWAFQVSVTWLILPRNGQNLSLKMGST